MHAQKHLHKLYFKKHDEIQNKVVTGLFNHYLHTYIVFVVYFSLKNMLINVGVEGMAYAKVT